MLNDNIALDKKEDKCCSPLKIYNGQSKDSELVTLFDVSSFRKKLLNAVSTGLRISSFYAAPVSDKIKVTAVLSDSSNSQISLLATIINDNCWESLVDKIPAVHLFERELAEQWNIKVTGHPWLKPVRFQPSYNDNSKDKTIKPGVTQQFRVSGDGVHEVAVGPVHAGIIEPGHFRFQCNGEEVINLEITLGYQHRGIQKNLIGGPDKKTIFYIENVTGDSTIAHTTAYCEAIESLSGCTVSAKAQAIRGIALELERLANHTGDLGAISQDIGFLPTSSFCGRLRGDFLNMTALLCGNRFGRGLIKVGGVAFDLDKNRIQELQKRLTNTFTDVKSAVELLWDNPTVLARLESTGRISSSDAMAIGLVGMPARACGINSDVRNDFPSGIYRFFNVPVSTWHSGDVFARAYVRWFEIQRSVAFIFELLKALPSGKIMETVGKIRPNSVSVAMAEGWRGEVCHTVETDKQGQISNYKIVDPSFHNWTGLSLALRNQQISDFPLINKSFNLSYCGHDL